MKTKKRKYNNLSFIATYLFQFPGASATEVRKALWVYRNKMLCEKFSLKNSYISYFQTNERKSHRGYAPRYWKKVNRSRWSLTADGLYLVEKSLLKRTVSINKKIKKRKKKRVTGRSKG